LIGAHAKLLQSAQHRLYPTLSNKPQQFTESLVSRQFHPLKSSHSSTRHAASALKQDSLPLRTKKKQDMLNSSEISVLISTLNTPKKAHPKMLVQQRLTEQLHAVQTLSDLEMRRT
jgi:hypothetical protein